MGDGRGMGRDKKPLTKVSNSERGGGVFAPPPPPPQIYLGAMSYSICSSSMLLFYKVLQGKSVSSYLFMNINDLGAMAVSSVV